MSRLASEDKNLTNLTMKKRKTIDKKFLNLAGAYVTKKHLAVIQQLRKLEGRNNNWLMAHAIELLAKDRGIDIDLLEVNP